MSESDAERQARLLRLAQDEQATEAKHNFQEALAAKPEVKADAAPGLLARALYRLGWQSKLALYDPVAIEQKSNRKDV